jgi:PHD/YefM family antitoxin component YafN of YafNO toxin-antitoxin module
MTTDEYRIALDAAVREYEALGQQRREIDTRLAQLAQTIGTLNRLCGFVPNVYWGLTDACRMVLKGAGRPMTPVEVRDRLVAIGFDLSKYVSSLAAIHTVLKRLAEAGEVRFAELGPGKFVYEWREGSTRVVVMNEAELASFELTDLEWRTAPKPNRRRKKRRDG